MGAALTVLIVALLISPVAASPTSPTVDLHREPATVTTRALKDEKLEQLKLDAAACERQNGLALLLVDPDRGIIVTCAAMGWTFPRIRERD